MRYREVTRIAFSAFWGFFWIAVMAESATAGLGKFVPGGDCDALECVVNLEAETDLFHQIGHSTGDSWAANVPLYDSGFHSFGPGLDTLSTGSYAAVFRIKIATPMAPNTQVAILQVHDRTDQTLIGSLGVSRDDFSGPGIYRSFEVPFDTITTHSLGFRVFWSDKNDLWLDWVCVRSRGPWKFEAESDFSHPTGQTGTGVWEAVAGTHPPGYLLTGPDTTAVPGESCSAVFRLRLDEWTSFVRPVALIDVYDKTSDVILNRQTLTAEDFGTAGVFRHFCLPFEPTLCNELQFRVYYTAVADIAADWVQVAVGSCPSPDTPTPTPTLTPTPTCNPDLWPYVFEAETDLVHQVGRLDGDGWSANVGQDDRGFLTFGPNFTEHGGGPLQATFRLMIDVREAANVRVCWIQVWDADANQSLALREIHRQDFLHSWTYQDFSVGFVATAGHRLQFRTYFLDQSYVKIDHVRLRSSGPWRFEAEDDFYHDVGGALEEYWAADPAFDPAGRLMWGPFTDAIGEGARAAHFALAVGTLGETEEAIAEIEVYDAGTGESLNQRTLLAGDFGCPTGTNIFCLPFDAVGCHQMEFRVDYTGAVYLAADYVEVRAGACIPTDTPTSTNTSTFTPSDTPTSTPTYTPTDTFTPTSTPTSTCTGEENTWYFQAETDLLHQIGRLDGDGWSANVAQDNPGFLSYGPGFDELPAGYSRATFRLMIDVHQAPDEKVAWAEVYDNDIASSLQKLDIYRSDFQASWTYQDFDIAFPYGDGHALQFRTYWFDKSYMNLDYVRVQYVGPYFYEAETDFFHHVGHPVTGGWGADPNEPYFDPPGFLLFGPFTQEVPGGDNTAFFNLFAENIQSATRNVALVDVFDSTAGERLAQRGLVGQAFLDQGGYGSFCLPFRSSPCHVLQFRVYYTAHSDLMADDVMINFGPCPTPPTPTPTPTPAEGDNCVAAGEGSGVAGSSGNILELSLANPSDPVKGFQFNVVDTPDMLTCTGVSAVGRAAGFIPSFSDHEEEGVEILGFSMSGDLIAPGPIAPFLELTYSVDVQAGSGYVPMTFTGVQFADENSNTLPITPVNGVFEVTGGSCTPTPADTDTPTPTPNDTDTPTPTPTPNDTDTPTPTPTVDGDALIIESTCGAPGGSDAPVDVLLQNPSSVVRGVEVTVRDNPDYLTMQSVEAIGRAAGFAVSFNEHGVNGADILLFSLSAGTIAPGPASAVMTLHYAVDPGASGGIPLLLEDVNVADGNSDPLPVTSVDGVFTADSGC